jgi:hypothetical protein
VIIALSIILYAAYFTASMIISNPFAYLSRINGTENVLDEYIFSDNQGLALLVLTVIGLLVIIWDLALADLCSKYLVGRFKVKGRLGDFIEKFGVW